MSDGGLRGIFRTKIQHWQWTSVESPGTVGGIPDSEFCGGIDIQGWVEFKWTDIYYVHIKPLQVAWLSRRYRLNKRSFIAVRRVPNSKKERGVDELWLMGGDQAPALYDRGLLGVRALCWSGGPEAWPFNEIEQVLIHGFNSQPDRAIIGHGEDYDISQARSPEFSAD
jgi:hypothetical protein